MYKTNSVSIMLTAIVATLLLFVPAILLTQPAGAQEEPAQTSEESSSEDGQEVAVEGSYTFVAQPGDSYSKMARKAVQIYGIENNTILSNEQIVFAETNMTLEAESPMLVVGQEVVVQKSTVQKWVDQANDLSDSQKAAWTKYVAGTDFNTNNVGE